MTSKQGYSSVLVLCLAFAGYVLVKTKPANVGRDEEDLDLRTPAAVQPAPQQTNVLDVVAPIQTEAEDPAEKKVKILDEIFASRNDNDPRLDTEFKNLSLEEKQRLERKYAEQPKEKLNERGTLVFLLGRNIEGIQDLTFLRSVAAESPCNDFNNCSRLSEGPRDEHAGIDEITLAYPQVVALKAIDGFLNSGSKDIQMRRMAEEIVATALKSKNGVINNLAQDILNEAPSDKL